MKVKTLIEEITKTQYIDYYFDHFDLDEMSELVDACLKTEGLILFTGVGKSGIIADKIAMTLISQVQKRSLCLPRIFYTEISAFSPIKICSFSSAAVERLMS